jgi:hypothetical protein
MCPGEQFSTTAARPHREAPAAGPLVTFYYRNLGRSRMRRDAALRSCWDPFLEA